MPSGRWRSVGPERTAPRVAVPSEVKNHEYRVAITPVEVAELVAHGHEVHVQAGAGLGSSISDAKYVAQGARIVPTAAETWAIGELVLKVKEPVAGEVVTCATTCCCSPTSTSSQRGRAPTPC